MLKDQSQRLHNLLISLDVALSGALFLGLLSLPRLSGLTEVPDWSVVPALLPMGLVACLAWPLTLQEFNLYESQRRTALETVLTRLCIAGGISTVLIAVAALLFRAPVTPQFPLWLGAIQFAVLASERLLIFAGLRMARRWGRNTRNLLIVGSGPRAAHVQRLIRRHPQWGLVITGFVDDSELPLDPEIPPDLAHKLVDMPALLRDQVVDEVIIACPRSMLGELQPVVAACGSAGVPFTLLADIFGDYLPPPTVTRFDSLVALRFASVHHSPARLRVKRAMDVVGAALGLVLAAPALAAAGLLIRATSSGPAFFSQTRSGLYGREFSIYKLRTMYEDSEEKLAELMHLNEMDGPVFKLSDDPRITPVGRLLRRFSLDEIPQLWNVLRGDMSLVGPRPPMPYEVAQYETFEHRRLSMRPGITCLWQVSGRNRIHFDEWVRLDLEYIDTWSLTNDLKLLLKTIPAVLHGTGAS